MLRAGNTRFKHPRSWTKEEREWASLDKILNPELWHGLKLRSMKDQSQETADQLQSYLKPADCIKETVDPEDVPPPSVAKKKSMFGRVGNLFGQVVSSALTTTVDDAAKLATEEGRDWNCPLSRPQIMEVWAAARPQACTRVSPSRPSERLKLGHDVPLIHSTAWRAQHDANATRDLPHTGGLGRGPLQGPRATQKVQRRLRRVLRDPETAAPAA